MATTGRELRELIARTRTGTHRTRVPPEVKAEVLAFAEVRRTEGATWSRVAQEVGLDPKHLRAWRERKARPAPRPLRSVETAGHGPAPALIAPWPMIACHPNGGMGSRARKKE